MRRRMPLPKKERGRSWNFKIKHPPRTPKENKSMKRIFLLIATNVAVMLVLSVVVSVLGVDRWLLSNGIDYMQLLVYSAIFGFGGAFLSLLMSHRSAHRSARA